MPEITDAQLTEYHQFRAIGATPSEVQRKIDDLVKDNGKQRDELREAKDKLKAVPAEGAVVLTGDDAAAWPKYQTLGKPEELEKAKGERDELQKKMQLREREDAVRAAVKAQGWPEDTAATLLDMRSLDGAAFEVKTEKVDEKGKQVDKPVPYVTLAGDGQNPQKLAEFAASAPQLKGLRTEAGGSQGGGGQGGHQPFIQQGSASGGDQNGGPSQEQVATAKRAGGDYEM